MDYVQNFAVFRSRMFACCEVSNFKDSLGEEVNATLFLDVKNHGLAVDESDSAGWEPACKIRGNYGGVYIIINIHIWVYIYIYMYIYIYTFIGTFW